MSQTNPAKISTKEACYVKSICTKCDFFDGTDDDLECAAYKILKGLVDKKVITIADIDNATITEE